eukprot:1001289-Ditylum_brightwellii.AAC.1
MSYLDWASLPSESWPVVTLTVSFDTCWQTKGTGKTTILCLVTPAWLAYMQGRSYKGSRKGIEATMLLEPTIHAKRQRRFIVGFIVTDDDSSMRATLKHSYKHLLVTMP